MLRVSVEVDTGAIPAIRRAIGARSAVEALVTAVRAVFVARAGPVARTAMLRLGEVDAAAPAVRLVGPARAAASIAPRMVVRALGVAAAAVSGIGPEVDTRAPASCERR